MKRFFLFRIVWLFFLAGFFSHVTTKAQETSLSFEQARHSSKFYVPGFEASARNGFSQFIVPNELHFHLNKAALKSCTGTLYSVGTFRTLFHFGLSSCSHLVMVDNNHHAVRFNAENLQAISTHESRADYIRWLLESSHFGNSSEVPFIHMRIALNQKFAALSGDPQALESFWFSDDIYKKTREAVLSGRIKVARGNVFDVIFWEELFSAVGSSFPELGVIDLSNALDYGSSGFTDSLALWNKINPSATLLTTTGYGRKLDTEKGWVNAGTGKTPLSWTYYSVNVGQLSSSVTVDEDYFAHRMIEGISAKKNPTPTTCTDTIREIL